VLRYALLVLRCAVQRFCKDNPSRFHNADSAYMLSFSIIMLNTGTLAVLAGVYVGVCMGYVGARSQTVRVLSA
jgi:hypothetical protein